MFRLRRRPLEHFYNCNKVLNLERVRGMKMKIRIEAALSTGLFRLGITW